MKVILLEDVKSLGKKGDVVDVNDGYARNFVLPKKLGIEANNKNMNDLKLKKANDEKLAQEQLKAAQDFAKAMEEDEVVLSMKAGEGGRTFGSISTWRLRKATRNSAEKKSIRRRSSFPKQLRVSACSRWA